MIAALCPGSADGFSEGPHETIPGLAITHIYAEHFSFFDDSLSPCLAGSTQDRCCPETCSPLSHSSPALFLHHPPNPGALWAGKNTLLTPVCPTYNTMCGKCSLNPSMFCSLTAYLKGIVQYSRQLCCTKLEKWFV